MISGDYLSAVERQGATIFPMSQVWLFHRRLEEIEKPCEAVLIRNRVLDSSV